ncbi:Putative acetyltransferases and hydrolase with the alpha/beta hydrolase fold protein [Minicystis rosea]|nr:Putative acetyltransferases and hydrolase with the alpha/beta hydrolase fold protein [Minicystis rosea]
MAALFDSNSAPEDSFSVVGTVTPSVSWSWGALELLEGHQTFRTEGYNRRSQKLRRNDTYQSSEYPLKTYFGELNQEIVDAFNLAYGASCATGTAECAEPGPTRPAARYVVLHKGPQTTQGLCSAARPPVLLVHGSLQDGNVWLYPNGNDGSGHTFENASQLTGMTQALEADGRCVYAVTFGNFHGDNYNHAIHVANAIGRIRQIHNVPRVDVISWSMGGLAVDTYLANPANWTGWSTRWFDQVAAAQAARVPHYRDDIRAYITLSGPHLGIDLNFRHPIDTLTIASTSYNAPVGRGPMPWTFFSALQCVTWGPDSPWYQNPYAASVCQSRGGTWPDFFNRIYVSNLTGLDTTGKPVSATSLKTLNTQNGASSSGFSFDEYNLSLFGSVNDAGRHVSPYLGQLQAAYDLRPYYPIPLRNTSAWSDVDQDEARWFPWIDGKLVYNPYNIFLAAGYLDDDDHTLCRNAAFEVHSGACAAYHAYNTNANREGYDSLGYARYRLHEGLGIAAAVEMGGHFIQHLSAQGLDTRLPALFVYYGTGSTTDTAPFETDGRSCPTCNGHSDDVLFEKSVAALDQLTQGWTTAQRSAKATQEAVALGHLEIGVSPIAFNRVKTYLHGLDGN